MCCFSAVCLALPQQRERERERLTLQCRGRAVNVGDRSCAMPLHSVAHVTSGVRYALILSEDMYASAAS